MEGDHDMDWRSYDSVADDYARVVAPHLSAPASDLAELLGIGDGARLLDVGTGTGVSARAALSAAGTGSTVVGADPSLSMLNVATSTEPRALYVCAQAIDMPFPDGFFTHVTACFVLSHFPRYETALYDVLRVTSTGGRMGVTAWGPGRNTDEFSRTWREVAEQFAGREILEDAHRRAVPGEELFSDRTRLKDVLHEAGLRDIWVEARDYRFPMTVEEYLTAREISSMGRFLRQMLGEGLWGTFRARSRQVFTERFPERMNEFQEVILAVGHKP